MEAISKRLVLKNAISELRVLSSTVEKFCESNGFSDKVSQDMRLVLEEIFSNIVFYGFPDQDEHQISLTISLRDNSLVLEIEDDGIPFNLTEYDTPNPEIPFEERDSGGMGIPLVKVLVDEIEYFRKQKKNVLVLRKKNILF